MTRTIRVILAVSALLIAGAVVYALVIYPVQRDRYRVTANRDCLKQSETAFNDEQTLVMKMIDESHPLVSKDELESWPKNAADNTYRNCMRWRGLD